MLAVPPPPETLPTRASLLQEAAARLAARVQELPEWGAAERDEVLERVGWVAKCLEAILDGADPGRLSAECARPGQDVRLLQALRVEVLRTEGPPGSEASVLGILRALESLLGALAGQDPDDLRARLSRPDAFELLVEVAHDLRSPLTSVLFLSETLRSGHSGDVNEHQRSQLGLIYSAALGLVSVASDIVDLARQEQGLVQGEPEAFSIQDALQSVEEMVRPMAEEKRIELIVSAPHYDRAYGHPVALGRVMLNLTTNAVKFTDKGFVEVGAKRHGRRRIEFYVRDTGRGISPELQGELFQPFKKRQTREGHFFSGSGVGLSIARRLVRAMGSELQLETAPDWGTRFFFLLDIPPIA